MPIHARASIIAAAIAAGLCAAPTAAAQSAGSGDAGQAISVYAPDYFAATAPTNAYEMVQRLPGFSIVKADADVRGYAAAQGNVLIDGARPASKREDIADLLKRIPSQTVERIELVRSGAPGIDMAGYALLVNVVRHRQAKTEAAIEAGMIASTDGWSAPRAQAEYGRRWEDQALDLALKLEPELDDDSGRGHIRTLSPDGRLLEESLLDTRTIKTEGEASASWRQKLGTGRLTLTAALRGEQTRVDTDIHSLDSAGESERVDQNEDFTQAEIGARYVRPIGERSILELVASQQLGWLDSVERSREADERETFEETTDTGESIVRLDLTHEWSERVSLAASLEGAFNFLESQAQLQQQGEAVFLPGSDVRIEERRIEAAAGLTWKLAEAWMLEAGMRVENSAISQTGDSPLERRFTYPKPRLALRWDAGENDQLRLSVSREVGQLNFADFVASASLDTGVVTAGNAELEPDKTWRMTVAWEHHFWTDAALTLSWTHDRISDVVDRVLVFGDEEIFDAPGNIGDGRRNTLGLELSAPLDRFGFSGAHLRTSVLWRDSQVTDPVTGGRRGISEEKPVEASIALTQDLPALRFNWGLEIEHIGERKDKYRFDEVAYKREDTGWTLFAERKLSPRWRVRAEATDLFGRDFASTRRKYDGPRSSVPLEEIETRHRTTPGYFSLSFRRSMGD